MVMIGHLLSAAQRCDRLVRLDHGAVMAIGPPSLILTVNP
jgi:predicted ABC-type transport system involved in lysophospholipase L1 biosynthesis ATPase subunit